MARSVALKSAIFLVLAALAFLRLLQIIMVSPATGEYKGPSELAPDPKQESSKVKLCPMPAYVSPEAFRDYEKQKQYECKELQYFGVGDGSKGVCTDPVFSLDKNDCKVLSFGISIDWTFDEAFGVYGCKVYSFDPTIGKGDHQHAPNVQFFNLGISNKTENVKIRGRFCKLDTYGNILKRLDLLDSVIDYLKMDVELAELRFFDDIFTNTPHLLLNIKQIGMETHYGGKGLRERFWDYYHRLACNGFKVMDARQYSGRTEIVWGRP
ncbi:uncharacterized protein [Macrobrachium rosenbergii]|uniref:uncharacterized protein n=1 Tax=Macrobrachium rosenbergii TaxID=79674 RepID=UPI0034D5B2E9